MGQFKHYALLFNTPINLSHNFHKQINSYPAGIYKHYQSPNGPENPTYKSHLATHKQLPPSLDQSPYNHPSIHDQEMTPSSNHQFFQNFYDYPRYSKRYASARMITTKPWKLGDFNFHKRGVGNDGHNGWSGDWGGATGTGNWNSFKFQKRGDHGGEGSFSDGGWIKTKPWVPRAYAEY